MESFDIIIYAAIAAFLFSRLWSVLGQRDEEDQTPPNISNKRTDQANPFVSKNKRDQKEQEDNVIVLEGRAKGLHSEELTDAGHAKQSLAGKLDQLKEIDPAFEEKKFVEGAKKAFEEIVHAFAQGDLSSVSRFLGPQVKEPFEAAIKARMEEGKKLINRIDRIVAADIISVVTKRNVAVLTVEFLSHQTNQFLDKNETPEEKEQSEEIRDRWVFERDLKSENPNWKLIETQS